MDSIPTDCPQREKRGWYEIQQRSSHRVHGVHTVSNAFHMRIQDGRRSHVKLGLDVLDGRTVLPHQLFTKYQR